MNMHTFVDWFVVFFVVTLLYLLVRPGSGSVALVDAFSKGMVAMTSLAADF